MTSVKVRVVLLLLVAAAGACAGSPTAPTLPPTPLTVSLQNGLWQTIGEPNPFPLANNPSQHLVFDLPTAGSIHYLFTPSALTAIRGTLVLSLQVTTSGAAVFESLDPVTSTCSIPASVRPFFWANGNGNGEYDRWWSNPRSFPLANGRATIAVPLSPESWSSVNGKVGDADSFARYGFATAIVNVSRLGLTFGGGCSFGHGVRMSAGSADFAVLEYAIR